MNILRITDLDGNFLRDDFYFDETSEIGLDVEAAKGLYKPKWDGSRWIEVATSEYIDSLRPNNDQIEEMRAEQYKLRSDELYMAWQKYVVLGDSRADKAKQLWIDEISKINMEYPYN